MSNKTATVGIKSENEPEIVKLDIQGINTGFTSSLGIDFVTSLYEAIAKSKCGFGFVAQEQDEIIKKLG